MIEKIIPIPEDIALKLCEDVRERNSKKEISLAKVQCWGCTKYSNRKGDIKHRCIFFNENNRGCHLVNRIFDAE